MSLAIFKTMSFFVTAICFPFLFVSVSYRFKKNLTPRTTNRRTKVPKKTGPGNTRVLKTKGNVLELLAIIIQDKKEIEKAIKNGWIGIFKQGRNSNGDPRPPKYQMNVEKIPQDNVVQLS